jgi:hypothetical protein
MSIYNELIDNVTDMNNYADSTGFGREMINSWDQSKNEYLKRSQEKKE